MGGEARASGMHRLTPLLALLLTACAERELPAIPDMLLAPCAEPVWEGGTNGDLVEYVGELREALGRCNADKAAISKIVGQTTKER